MLDTFGHEMLGSAKLMYYARTAESLATQKVSGCRLWTVKRGFRKVSQIRFKSQFPKNPTFRQLEAARVPI